MSEEQEAYIIAGQDPEEILNFGPVRFVRPLHGRVRIEIRVARMQHTQRLTENDEIALKIFMMNFEHEQNRKAVTQARFTCQEGDESEEEEGELEGAPTDFLRIDEDRT